MAPISRTWYLVSAAALFFVSGLAGGAESRLSEATASVFNASGNVLIADQFNNRVIEVDPQGNIVWQFGNGSSVPGPRSVVAPNDIERLGTLSVISGTGAPPGSEDSCPDGCPDNRVLVVSKSGAIVQQYGQAGVTGSGPNELNTPVCAVLTPFFHTLLITDQGNHRVIQVDSLNRILWQYGTTGVPGFDTDQLNNPNSAEPLPNGNVLIADESNNRVIEVTRQKRIVWQYGSPDDTDTLNGAAFASRLPSGHTLITDANNNRVIEVTPGGTTVFEYDAESCSNDNPALPTRGVRLRNGNTLVSGQFNQEVLEVEPNGTVARTIGTLCVAGTGPNELNGPYDAKVVGDNTGLVP